MDKLTTAIMAGLIVCLAGITGCAKRPELELAQAKQALESADSADAEKYASYEYTIANDAFNAGVNEMKRQDSVSALTRGYDEARVLLRKAADQALCAKTSAIAARQRIGTELLRN